MLGHSADWWTDWFLCVQVQLVTRSGAIKFTAEPAPNGYYMIPIYEKGDYKVQLVAEQGWNFGERSAMLD